MKLAFDEQLTPEQRVRVTREVERFKLACRNPVFREHARSMIKQAADYSGIERAMESAMAPKSFASRVWEGATGHLAPAIGMTLMSGLGMIGERLVRDAIGSVKGSIEKGRFYKKMLDNPENHDLKQHDALKTQNAFHALYSLNPDFAKDPYLAGSYVRQAIDMGGFAPQTAREMVQARRQTGALMDRPAFDPSFLKGEVRPHPAQIAAWQAQMAGQLSGIEQAKREEQRRAGKHQFELKRLEQQVGAHPGEVSRAEAEEQRRAGKSPLEIQRLEQQIGAHAPEMQQRAEHAAREAAEEARRAAMHPLAIEEHGSRGLLTAMQMDELAAKQQERIDQASALAHATHRLRDELNVGPAVLTTPLSASDATKAVQDIAFLHRHGWKP